MPSAGGHHAGFEELDVVGPVEQQRAGRDEQGAPARAVVGEQAGDPGLGVGVDGARRLDEDEDVRGAKEGAGEGDPLALPSGEGAAALVEAVVEPVVEGFEDVTGRGGGEGGIPVGVRGATEGGPQGAAEQVGVGLADDDRLPDGADRPVIERGLAPRDAVPAGDQPPSSPSSGRGSSARSSRRSPTAIAASPGSTGSSPFSSSV